MDHPLFSSVVLIQMVILVMGRPQLAVPQELQQQSLMTAHIVVEVSLTTTTGLSPFLDPSPSHHQRQQTSQLSSAQVSLTLLLDFLL